MSRRTFAPLALAVAWLAGATGATAQNPNLISNAEFHENVVGWTRLEAVTDFAWNGFDWTECGPLSGSALMTNFSSAEFGTAWARICVPAVDGGSTYSFGGYLRFVTGQATTGRANVSTMWMGGPDCTGGLVGVDEPAAFVTTATAGSWVLSHVDESLAPANAGSAIIEVFLVKNEDSGTLELRVDGLYFVAAPGFVFRDGFGLESTCRWSAEQL